MIKFTKEEKTVLVFLLAALFAGSAVMYYKKISPHRAKSFEFKQSKKEYSKKININKTSKTLHRLQGYIKMTKSMFRAFYQIYRMFERK